MDCVLVQNDTAHQIWPDTTKAALCFKLHDGEVTPRAIFHPDIVTAIVEVEAGSVVAGAVYADGAFTNPAAPPAPRRLIRKALIIDRLQAAGLLAAGRAALDAADLYTQERWNVRTEIYVDDPAAIAMLNAIGADPEVILAPE